MRSQKIIFIVGPTAVGKSQIAYYAAKHIDAEIISCDAMQVYREVSIATSKPSPEVLKKVPHHLVNIVSVEDDFNVGTFNQLALKAVNSILKSGKVPFVVGGSGMYMKVLLDGIFEEDTKDLGLRENLKKTAEKEGNQYLYDMLSKQDPQAAKKIHPNDLKRLVRALEVIGSKNRPISDLQKEKQGLWGNYDIKIFGIEREREELYRRIDNRVDAMFEEGLVEEIKDLGSRQLSRTARSIIGVPEIRGYLQEEYPLDRAKYLMKRNTRHFAKRQMTWFRKEERIEWISVGSDIDLNSAGKRIIKYMEPHG